MRSVSRSSESLINWYMAVQSSYVLSCLCYCFLLQGDAFAVSVKSKAEVSEIFLSKKVGIANLLFFHTLMMSF